jgi:hypothetical protein
MAKCSRAPNWQQIQPDELVLSGGVVMSGCILLLGGDAEKTSHGRQNISTPTPVSDYRGQAKVSGERCPMHSEMWNRFK